MKISFTAAGSSAQRIINLISETHGIPDVKLMSDDDLYPYVMFTAAFDDLINYTHFVYKLGKEHAVSFLVIIP